MREQREDAARHWSVGCAGLGLLLITTTEALAQPGYQKPPQVIEDVLNAPPTPLVSLSPTRDRLLLVEGVRYPPITDLAEPMLRLAGLRINPRTNGPHRPPRYLSFTLQNVAGGELRKLPGPANAHLGAPVWAPDGKH